MSSQHKLSMTEASDAPTPDPFPRDSGSGKENASADGDEYV
jgi:hypothetical protein